MPRSLELPAVVGHEKTVVGTKKIHIDQKRFLLGYYQNNFLKEQSSWTFLEARGRKWFVCRLSKPEMRPDSLFNVT